MVSHFRTKSVPPVLCQRHLWLLGAEHTCKGDAYRGRSGRRTTSDARVRSANARSRATTKAKRVWGVRQKMWGNAVVVTPPSARVKSRAAMKAGGMTVYPPE